MATLNVYDLYLSTLDQINEEQRGQLTIDRFNRFANNALLWFVDYLTGRLQDMPQPKMEAINHQKIADYLRPLLKKKIQPFSASLISFPSDYGFLLDLRITGGQLPPQDCTGLPQMSLDRILSGNAGFRQVDVLPHDRVPSRLNTYIPMLKKRPFAEQYGEGFVLSPYRESGSAFIAYIAEPFSMKLVMTIDPATNGLVYDSVNSVNPPVDTKARLHLARKTAQFFFNWTREDGAIQSSDAVANTE